MERMQRRDPPPEDGQASVDDSTVESGQCLLDAPTQRWLESVPGTVYVTGPNWWLGDLHFVSESIVELGQRPADDYRDQPALWLRQMAIADRQQALDTLQRAETDGESRLRLVYTLERDGDVPCRIEDQITLTRDAQGGVLTLTGVLGVMAQEETAPEQTCQAVLRHCGDLILSLDDELDCLGVLGNAVDTLGMQPDQLLARSLFSLMAPEDGARVQRTLLEQAGEASPSLLEVRLQHRDGSYRWFEIHFSPYADLTSPAAMPGWVAVARNITERRHQSLKWDAYTATDELTSALNRSAFMGLLRHALSFGPSSARLSMIVFDVDYLDDINHSWGRDGGDLVLTCIGELCRATLRERFSFGRLEDDTFAILLSGKSLQETASIAERLRERFAVTRVEFHGHWLTFSVSLGVAERRVDETAEGFLARAGEGVRAAKQHGRDRVHQAP